MSDPKPLMLSQAEVNAIAGYLRADPKRSLQWACIEAGCGDRFGAIRKAVNRAKRGEETSEERYELLDSIVQALAHQCESLLGTAMRLADDGKATSLYTWLLAKKDRVEYGEHVKHELVGLNDGPVQTEDVSKLSDEELLKRWLAVNPAQAGGGG